MGKGRFRIKSWHIPVGLVLFCGLSGAIYEWASLRGAERAIQEEVAKLRALGIPTSPAEMPKPGPDDKNAALIYNEAFKLKKAIGVKRPSENSGRPDPNLPAKLIAYVNANQPVMDLVRLASELPDCNFNRNWAQGAALLFPEFTDLKEFTQLAVLNAEIEAKAGRYQKAFSWLRIAQKISVHVREPILIGQLMSIVCEQIVIRELQTEIRLYHTKPEFVRLAREFCDHFPPLPLLRESLTGEILMVRTLMADISAGRTNVKDIFGSESNFSRGPVIALRLPSVRAQVEQLLLSRYRKVVEQLPTNPHDFRAELTAAANLDELPKADSGMVGQLSSMFVPAFAGAGHSSAKLEAARRITRQGLEIFVHKAATGFLPKALDPSKPWAIDPFNEKPLMYKFVSDGFGLYSIGANLKDDDGFPQYAPPTGSRIGTDDVAFYRPPAPVKPRNRVKTAP